MITKKTCLNTKILLLLGTIKTGKKPPECFWTIDGDLDFNGMSIGPLRWNFEQMTFQSLLTKLITVNNIAYHNSIGAYANILKDVLDQPLEKQMQWIRSIQKNNNISGDWLLKFQALGKTPEFQKIMVEDALLKYFLGAKGMMPTYELKSQRGYALLCYIRTQNEYIKEETKKTILKDFKNAKTEEDKLKIIVSRRAEIANSESKEDAIKKEFMIANGSGMINDMKFDLSEDYFITMENAF